MAKKLTKNSFKRKVIVFGIMIFMSVALISTGFAAWIISTSQKGQVQGNISVGVVTEESIKIENVQFKDGISSFAFEPKENDNEGRLRWDGTNKESLTVTITAKVTGAQYLDTLTLKLDLSGATGVSAAATATAGYIALPACANGVVVAQKSAGSVAAQNGAVFTAVPGEDGSYNLEYTITFTWGSKFETMNPSEYYDTEGKGAGVTDEAMKAELLAFRQTMYGVAADQANASHADLNFKVIIEATAAHH